MTKRAEYRITANKTKMYALAKRYCENLPPMKKTKFIKYLRVRDYGLEFWSGDSFHHLFLSAFGGRATLGDKATAYFASGDSVTDWNVHNLKVDELRELGLLEEIKE